MYNYECILILELCSYRVLATHVQTILDKVVKSTNMCNHLMSPTPTAASLSKSPQAQGSPFLCSPGNSPDEEEEEKEEEEEVKEKEVEEGSGSLRTDSPSIQEMIGREHSYSRGRQTHKLPTTGMMK